MHMEIKLFLKILGVKTEEKLTKLLETWLNWNPDENFVGLE